MKKYKVTFKHKSTGYSFSNSMRVDVEGGESSGMLLTSESLPDLMDELWMSIKGRFTCTIAEDNEEDEKVQGDVQ